MTEPCTYSSAGVDIDRGNALVKRIKALAQKTHRSGVMGGIGGFGGLFSLNLTNIENPVLVSSTDGVGTKLKIAFMMNKHDTIGIDLVAMSVNDILVQGAKPLFFLDYFATGKLDIDIATEVIKGITDGCNAANCALLGGETAEMPGFYAENEYDLAGFAVGIVDNKKIIDGSAIRVGDVLISIPSSGLHSNGYSLARKICFEILNLSVDSHVSELGKTIGEELLTPTRIYVETIRKISKSLPIHGLAHITGGGLLENIVRVVPESCGIEIRQGSWYVPPIFSFLQEAGKIQFFEMMRTFNNGIGMVLIVPEKSAQDVLGLLRAMNENSYIIGQIAEKRSSGSRVHFI